MKFDKEMAIKHRFWIGLGVFFLLWLISLLVLKFSAADRIATARNNYDSSKKALDAIKSKNPKNDEFLKPWNRYADIFRGEKNKVWEKAWKLQEHMAQWPSSRTAPLQQQLKYFEDPFDALQRVEYKDMYDLQFKDLDKLVYPIDVPGGVRSVLKPVAWKKAPTKEEAWLAQEDFWVKKELLKILRGSLDSLARMPRVPGKSLGDAAHVALGPGGKLVTNEDNRYFPEAEPDWKSLGDEDKERLKNVVARYQFKNPDWEIDLLIEKRPDNNRLLQISPFSRITNVHPNKRTQLVASPRTNEPLTFALVQEGARSEIKVEGEPLPWGKSVRFKKAFSVESIDLNNVFELEQVFDWSTSPIRRIDEIELSYHSARTIRHGLKPSHYVHEEGAEAPAAPAGGGQNKGATPPPPPPPPSGGQGKGDSTPQGLARNRYVQVTEVCRQMPIGMVLVVDQSAVHNLLVALADSCLRFQVTQVEIKHVTGVEPSSPDLLAGQAEEPPAGTPPRAPGVPPAPPLPGRPALQAATLREEDPNLVELEIYGIASLYERYPPRSAQAAQATGPAQAVPSGPAGKTPPQSGESKGGGPGPKPPHADGPKGVDRTGGAKGGPGPKDPSKP